MGIRDDIDPMKFQRFLVTLVTLLVLLVLSFMLFSCNFCKYAAKRCPPIIKDSLIYKETIKYRDTTIYVLLPKDTLHINDTVYIKQGMAVMPKVWRQIGIITATAEIKKSRLYVDAYLNDISFKVDLKNAIKETQYWKERYQEKVKVIEKSYIPSFYQFCFWFTIIVGGLLLLTLAFYIFKKLYLP